MIFQPISPLRTFQQRLKIHNSHKNLNDSDQILKMSPKITKTRPMSEALSQGNTVTSPRVTKSGSAENHLPSSWQGGTADQPEGTINDNPVLSEQLRRRRESVGTTNSSPTDPAYMPLHRELMEQPSIVPTENTVTTQKHAIIEEHSFFESDTEYSDDESPVIGRASSVRAALPRVISHVPTMLERTGTLHGPNSTGHAICPSASTLEPVTDEMDVMEETSSSSTQPENIQMSSKNAFMGPLPPLPHSPSETPLPNDMSPTTTKVMLGGLRSNPMVESDALDVPSSKANNRKVRIRPSDLVITHVKDNPRFRESIVSTPYPSGTKSDEPYPTRDEKNNLNDTPLANLSSKAVTSLRTHRSPHNSDRFPSPHQPEVLFLHISLARHPSISTTLEIKIIDKDQFDDEMLFRQLRATYHQRLLGWSRLPFCLIRNISHVTLSTTSVEASTLDTADFIRHLAKPRVGSKRKTWTIWLRNYNLQQSPISPRQDTNHYTVQKRPLTPRPAEKRLSMQSDSSSSVLKFSILPPLSVARIPFFRERLSQNQNQSRDIDIEKQHIFTSLMPNQSIRIDTSIPSSPPHPILVLHHTFSALSLLLVFSLTILAAITATTLWIIFGVPGNRPGQEIDNVVNLAGGTVGGGVQWSFSAQGRVLTGLVLGLIVLIVGWVGEAVMVLGGWVLI